MLFIARQMDRLLMVNVRMEIENEVFCFDTEFEAVRRYFVVNLKKVNSMIITSDSK